MIHRFHQDKNRWDGIEPHIYKENPGVFRDVTKQVLFDNEADLPVQFRYFQVEKGGFSSFEHHKHMHAVMISKERAMPFWEIRWWKSMKGISSPLLPGNGTSLRRIWETSLDFSVW